jgi:GTP diphosphokinase / guanosine-3',5'-bis(diphosphate) 3'-diphosphatase
MLKLIEKVREYLNLFDNNPDEVELLMAHLRFLANNEHLQVDQDKLDGVLTIVMDDLNLYSTALLAMVNIMYPIDSEVKLNSKIVQITEGFKNISQTDIEELYKNKSNFLDFALVSAGDLRALLLSMAVNLYELRKLTLSSDSKEVILNFAHEVYIPLCHRLGFYRIKSEMEDKVFYFRNNQIYIELQRKIVNSSHERDNFIKSFIRPIEEELHNQKINFKIKWRTKSIFSIYTKMLSQDIPFEKVFDLFAIRVIIDSQPNKEKSDCWHVFSVVTNIYKSDTKRLRDWISKPRENGYESLHITVETSNKNFVEVQIRTTRMDDEAENGMAAHWRYKGGKSDTNVNNFLLRIRKAIENKEVIQESYDSQTSSKDLFIFTPAGELKKMHVGATVLDFAFNIHSEIGVRCSGARVNGVLKPIKHHLKNGDRVEIITSRNQKPTLDWLNFVESNKAKSRIRKAVDEEKLKEAEDGKEILQRRLRNWKLEFNQDIIDEIASIYKSKTITEIYRDIFRENIDLSHLKKALSHRLDHNERADEYEMVEKKSITKSTNDDLVIDETDRLIYKLAACCHPVPGDNIFGFVTISKGITIHRADCPNTKSMFDRYSYRIIPARWKNKEDQSKFRAEIFLKGIDRNGVLADITKVVNGQASLLQVNISSIGNYFQGKITVGIHDKQQIGSLLTALNSMKEIVEAYRIGS